MDRPRAPRGWAPRRKAAEERPRGPIWRPGDVIDPLERDQAAAPEGRQRLGLVHGGNGGETGLEAQAALVVPNLQGRDPGAIPEAMPGRLEFSPAAGSRRVGTGERRTDTVARPEGGRSGVPKRRLFLGAAPPLQLRQVCREALPENSSAEALAQVVELRAPPKADLDGDGIAR